MFNKYLCYLYNQSKNRMFVPTGRIRTRKVFVVKLLISLPLAKILFITNKYKNPSRYKNINKTQTCNNTNKIQ